MTEKEWSELTLCKKYEAINEATGEKVRIQKENDGTGFQYTKRMKNRGYRLGKDYMLSTYQLVKKDENAAWHKRIRRVLKAINKTGLWADLSPFFESLQKMDYEDIQKVRDIWDMRLHRPKTEKLLETTNETFKKDYGELLTAYPFIFYTADDGSLQIKMDYVSAIADVKVKSTYFGKYNNAWYKKLIAEKITGDKKFIESVCAGYDVTYEFDPERMKAWYSEEYRGCGNGHYYLAFDENLAVFCEND